jgi:ABC-type branched-subunit amino acid transport system substrate-binding protein
VKQFWLIFLILLPLAACNQTEQIEIPVQRASGFTDAEVIFGSSLALTGHASYLGVQTLRGAMSYIQYINENGGVHGRTIRLIAYDDSYDPPQCVANTQRLMVEDGVFGLFCYVGTPTTVKILPLVEDGRIPLLGMFTGANALRVPFNRYAINVRASYYQETGAAVKHLVEDLDIRKIGVLYQYDAYGFDGLTGTELALKEYGLAPVASGSYIRGTLNVEEALKKIMASSPEAVVMIGTYEPCARFVKLALEQGFSPVYYTPSFAGAEELARRLESYDNIVALMSQVVPPPEGGESENQPGSSLEYIRLLKQYYPDDTPTFVGLEGYINARVLVEGLRRAGRNLTREGFLDALESMQDFSLGPRITLSFSSTDHQGLEQVYFTQLKKGHIRLIMDWSEIKRALQTPRGKTSSQIKGVDSGETVR